MVQEAFQALGVNAALLLAIVFVYDLALANPLRLRTPSLKVLAGLCLSAIAVSVMQVPWVFGQGIVFDTRSVLIGVCGLFFGGVPVSVVMGVAALARVLQGGGQAVLTGILVISISGALGLAWRRRLRRDLTSLGFLEIWRFGLVLHLAMLVAMLTLPWPTALDVVRTIWLPVMAIYPLATAVLGMLMVNRLKRELAAEELALREDQYRTLFETMVQGVLCHDPAGRILSANPAAAEILGLSSEEIVGRNLFEQPWLTRDEDGLELPADQHPSRQALATGRPVRNRVQAVDRPRGERRLLRTATIPRFRTGKTHPDQVYVVFEDITERRHAAAEKAAIEGRLAQSRKLESLGLMAGGVAHDFNNLLLGILGNVELLRETLPASSPHQENLGLIHLAAQRAANLTRGLLTFGRGSVGHPTSLDSNQTVGEIADLLRRTLPATMDIVRDFQADAWNIRLDATQLTQVLLNLAVNARDAMQGKGTLTLRTRNRTVGEKEAFLHPDARSGEFVLISVQDTGPGLPEEILQHLFEPFRTTKPLGVGTGLGLSIVYGAIKHAGGWIVVESTPGVGAHFDLYLPRSLAAPVPIPSSDRSSQAARSARVLVVEDEPVVQNVVSRLLKRRGHEVILARDGAQALELVERERGALDLVLLDMTMPGMTTEEILVQLRALAPSLPILLNSGNAAGEAVKAMMEEGLVQGFLAKPFDMRGLNEKVESLLLSGGRCEPAPAGP